ncbi:MAG: hypothetical protein MI673_04125 [Thiotrichales bacterium]|nr:hypothetical protein [Thiotrichales bacterium]
MRRLYVFICLIVFSLNTQSRPVSYPGGWTFMTMNDGDRYSAHIHYSPTAFHSLGYKAEFWRDEKYQIHAVQLNNLIKRWNKKHSQANLYLKSGAGMAISDEGRFDNEIEPIFYTGIAADWETRRYFVSYENRVTVSADITDNFRQKARIGIAPYIAEFGGIHTWFMLETRHAAEAEDKLVVTPLLRVFKGPGLLETGYGSNGKFLFNFVHRF